MKIDEAINFVENMMYLYRPTGEQHDKWCELLNLLRWYRDQDLILREDAIGEIEYECNCEQSEILHRRTIIDVIENTLKAEYRFDKDTNVPSKLATDTNVGDKEYVPIGEQHTSVWVHKAETIPPPPPPACHYCKHNLNDNECKECNFESLV